MNQKRIAAATLSAAMIVSGSLSAVPILAQTEFASDTQLNTVRPLEYETQSAVYYVPGTSDVSGTMTETIFDYNENPVLKNCQFERPGYVFKGWKVWYDAGSGFNVTYYLARTASGVLKAVPGYELGPDLTLALFQGGDTLPLYPPDSHAPDVDPSVAMLMRNGGSLYAMPQWEAATESLQRLYNPNSGEHFYTSDLKEKDVLVGYGWKHEGKGWDAPLASSIPVYRLYNPNAGDHHYTTSERERNVLLSVGWQDEGIGWYSDEARSVPLYRQYNPNAKAAGAHNYTTDTNERDFLVSVGWIDEDIAWYGVR